MFLKEYWFRELYLGSKVTASFDRSESYTRVIDGQEEDAGPQKLSRLFFFSVQRLHGFRQVGTFSLLLFLCQHG